MKGLSQRMGRAAAKHFSEHGRTSALTKAQQLWPPAQDPHKMEPVNLPALSGKGPD